MGTPTQKGVTVCFADREAASNRDSGRSARPAGQLRLRHSYLVLLDAELQGLPTAHSCRDDQVSKLHGSGDWWSPGP